MLPQTSRLSRLDAAVADAWRVVASGRAGPQWYVDSPPWVFRGAVDRLLGGKGRRWPPPDRDLVRTSDHVGFWSVVTADAPSSTVNEARLVLRAEVRAPGTVTLTTTLTPRTGGGCVLRQEIGFEPAGLPGRAYYLVDTPAREVLLTLVHRRLCHDVRRGAGCG